MRRAGAVRAMRLDHVIIAVSDWRRSMDFYRTVVGAEVIGCSCHGWMGIPSQNRGRWLCRQVK
jgi:predicted enzyme related to lactoylglutathione lyase